MSRRRYDLTLTTPRTLTPEELERVTRAALDELAQICGVPAEAPRTVQRLPMPKQEVKTA